MSKSNMGAPGVQAIFDTSLLTADRTFTLPDSNTTIGAGGTPPTGTGFPHITAGVQDAAALTVDQVYAMISGRDYALSGGIITL